MFRPAPMRKVNILVVKDDVEKVVERLHEAGLVQLVEAQISEPLQRFEGSEQEEQISQLSARLREVISSLEEAEPGGNGGGFISGMLGGSTEPGISAVPVAPQPREKVLEHASKLVQGILPQLEEINDSLKSSQSKIDQLSHHLHLVRDLMPIKVPLGLFRRLSKAVAFFFYLEEDRVEPFQQVCREKIKPVYISVISGTRRRLLIALSLPSEKELLLAQIHRFEGELIDLPPYEEEPSAAEAKIKKLIREEDAKARKAREALRDLARRHLKELRVASELVEIERERAEALGMFARTDRAALISGWIPEKDMKLLERTISTAVGKRFVIRSHSPGNPDGEDVPIQLENPKPFDNFEWITKMYGLPNYREVDPTPFILPTFAIFFGTCLTDAGYGLILLFLSVFFLRKIWGKMGTTFAICGVATVFMGWLTGGWFGNILYNESYGLGLSFFKAVWSDPLENPIPLLSLSLEMGIAHLLLGHVTAIMASARRGRLKQGLLAHGGWCLTLVFGSIFILWYMNMVSVSPLWRTLSTWGLAVGVVLGMTGYIWERSGSGRIAAPAQFMYDILGHVADVISYSRLLALGISTGVNAFLIDMIIVGIVWPGVPKAGIVGAVVSVVAAVVLAIGFVLLHLVNMGLNSLSGFVHTMRLHFAEYFGKFYEGGGEEFRPFKASRTITSLAQDGG